MGVLRRFNRPIGRVGGVPAFWMHQSIAVDWRCRMCNALMPKGSVTFEVFVGRKSATQTPAGMVYKQEGAKSFLCLECAEKMLEDAIERVRLVKERGPDAYDLLHSI